MARRNLSERKRLCLKGSEALFQLKTMNWLEATGEAFTLRVASRRPCWMAWRTWEMWSTVAGLKTSMFPARNSASWAFTSFTILIS